MAGNVEATSTVPRGSAILQPSEEDAPSLTSSIVEIRTSVDYRREFYGNAAALNYYSRTRFLSLFSGCGGFDLGFQSAGFSASGAFDLDPAAVENFRRNVSPHAERADLENGIPGESRFTNADVLIAGPPCQGFSSAGRRRLDDGRNHLLTLTGQLASRIKPAVVVVENVWGALAGEHARYWQALDGTLRHEGYRTHTLKCQVSDLGLAQTRRRILLVAWRTGRDAVFPRPPEISSTLRQALAGVAKAYNHAPKRLPRESTEGRIAAHIRPGQRLSNVRGGTSAVPTWLIPDVFGVTTPSERTVLELLRRLRRQDRPRKCGDADPVSLGRLEAALGARFCRLLVSLQRKGFVRRTGNAYDLTGTFNGKFRRLSWDGVSCTVDTRFGSPRYFLHPTENRGFTVREAARLQGFPDSYVFSGTERDQFRLIGNAVPPPLGRLAATYAKALLGDL